jgi:hypothetical protein
MDDTIIFTNNYYGSSGDPGDYYKDGNTKYISKPLPYRPVYVSDIIDNNDCSIHFTKYRNKNNRSENVKMGIKNGIVHSYNPENNLLEVISEKRNPTFKKFNTKLRYVEPENATVVLAHHSTGPPHFKARQCTLTRTNCDQKPECAAQLKKLVDEYRVQYAHFFKDYAIKAAGKRSKKNSKKKIRSIKRKI